MKKNLPEKKTYPLISSQTIKDHGPLYRETDLTRTIVEPWNTFSNLFFLLIVIYWLRKIFKSSKNHRFLWFALPLIFVGFVGGTLYHATRSHQVWLLMDWVPIMFLSLACSFYFSKKNGHSLLKTLSILFLPAGSIMAIHYTFKIPMYISMSLFYSSLALALFYPLFYYSWQRNKRHLDVLIKSVVIFILAALFRSTDHVFPTSFFPMGTHWLWHSLGAIAVHFSIKFIFLCYEDRE